MVAIVKLGGAAITDKSKFETLNEEALEKCIGQIAEHCKHKGKLHERGPLILVHGAGSFGHHHASVHEVQRGWCNGDPDKLQRLKGIQSTRAAVRKLNDYVMDQLLLRGVNAVAVPAFGFLTTSTTSTTSTASTATSIGLVRDAGYTTYMATVKGLLEKGIIPVLHGDIILHDTRLCAVLSGDDIISHLCSYFPRNTFSHVVFWTDVSGVYTRPPGEEGAKLMRYFGIEDLASDLSECSAAAHKDVTGGMKNKIKAAIECTKYGYPVLITKAGTEDADISLGGDPSTPGWAGTCICMPAAGTQHASLA